VNGVFTGCPAVDQISKLNMTGNIIPAMWYKNITFQNKKPHFVAITILSEIIYWYRPIEIRDEATGQLIGFKKKFKADMLQRNYQSFSDQFGFTKRQVKDAIDFLVEHKLINRVFRDIKAASGIAVNNVMYIEPIAKTIENITYEEMNIHAIPSEEQGPTSEHTEDIHSDVPPPTLERTTLLHSNVPPSYDGTEEAPTPERKTNTEITTKSTTKIEKEKEEEAPAGVQSKVPFIFFENNGFGMISGYMSEKISSWCQDISDDLVLEAMKLAVENGKKNWRYVETILRSWADKGIKTVEQVHAEQNAYREQKSKQRNKPKGGVKPKRQEIVPVWMDDSIEQPKMEKSSDTESKQESIEEMLKQLPSRGNA